MYVRKDIPKRMLWRLLLSGIVLAGCCTSSGLREKNGDVSVDSECSVGEAKTPAKKEAKKASPKTKRVGAETKTKTKKQRKKQGKRRSSKKEKGKKMGKKAVKKRDFDVEWFGPFLAGGGYASEAIAFVTALDTTTLNLRITMHGDSPNVDFIEGLPEEA